MSGQIAALCLRANMRWTHGQEAHAELYPTLSVVRHGSIGYGLARELTAVIPTPTGEAPWPRRVSFRQGTRRLIEGLPHALARASLAFPGRVPSPSTPGLWLTLVVEWWRDV
jgi:hypothetical protein